MIRREIVESDSDDDDDDNVDESKESTELELSGTTAQPEILEVDQSVHRHIVIADWLSRFARTKPR